MTQRPALPPACAKALAEIETDPLALSEASLDHLEHCLACRETRVAWLAQEAATAQAPAGYFEALPGRIMGKLPAAPRRRHLPFAVWALAAGLLAAMGVGGYLAGRANRAPLVEAARVPIQAVDYRDPMPDTPFQEGEEDYVQLTNLSPEETHRLMERVRAPEQVP